MNLQDTIVALSTPSGVGAFGLIRLSGPGAIEIANGVFSKNILDAGKYSVHFGKVMHDAEILDEVLLSVFRKPHSFTKEDVVEISFHGSPYILAEALSLFTYKGARLAEAGEFTLRAFLNGGIDLAQAEAVADLIASQSKVAHDAALRQMRGGFSKELKALREKLIEFASLVELELDFSEEDVEFADREQLITLVKKIKTEVSKLRNSFRLGNVIKSGVPTVIAGRPNAGKSTLLNALLNEQRAIVSEIPGTTRDTIEEPLNIGGIIFRLIDTAGLREATDTIEQQGINRTIEKIQESAILIYVYDAAQLSQEEVKEDLAALNRDDLKLIVIANKQDEVNKLHDNLAFQIEKEIPADHFYISSLSPQGTEIVKSALLTAATEGQLISDQTIVTSVRHYEALSRADAALAAAESGIASGLSGEFLAIDIRSSLAALGEITGEITTEDLLGSIFSKFCIGK